MDTRTRTLTKALVWNAIGFATMSLVGFLATGSFAVGGAMALVNTGLGLSMYVAYERIWERVEWGRHV